MDNFRPTLSRLHYPLEADRMVLRHRRSHNQNGVRVLQILLRCSSAAFGTQTPTRDGRFRIAFDGNQFSIFVINQLSAADAAVRTNGTRNLSPVVLGTQIPRLLGHGFRASAVGSGLNLPDEWPAGKQIIEHSLPP